MTRPLTERQLEILRLVVAGHSNAAIGRRLHISTHAAAERLKVVYRKLGATCRAQAVATAVALGLAVPEARVVLDPVVLAPPAEVAVARLMARLVAAGLTPAAAHRVARGGQLAPGITISIADEADVEDGAA